MTHWLERCRTLLESLDGEWGDLSRQLDANAERMAGARSTLASSDQRLADIEAVAREARILALNGRIEARRAGAKSGGFQVIANGLDDLSKRATVNARAMFDALHAMGAEVQRATDRLTDLAARFQERSTRMHRDVSETLQGIEATSGTLEAAVRNASEDAERIADGISQATATFQFQDRANQRANLVADSLDYLLEHMVATYGPAVLADTLGENPDHDRTDRSVETLVDRLAEAMVRMEGLATQDGDADDEPELF